MRRNKKRLKVALVMGGGVSLGAFNGGATAEIVRQLASNLNEDAYFDPVIDVMAGASAGAMTLGILLRTLANPEARDPLAAVNRLANNLQHAWVEDIDISRLLRDVTGPSFLNSEVVYEIAAGQISWPDNQPAKPILLGDRVCFSVTLLNYNGVRVQAENLESADVCVPTHGNREAEDGTTTTLFRDTRVFCLNFCDKANCEPPPQLAREYSAAHLRSADNWDTIGATILAAGAFPFAFPPVPLRRQSNEYGKGWPKELATRNLSEFIFTFADGGVFNNEPLKEAMKLISIQDCNDEPGSFERVLIFVDPHLAGTNEDLTLDFHRPLAIDPDSGLIVDGWDDVVPVSKTSQLASTARRLGGAILHQAAAKDLLRATRTNSQLKQRIEAEHVLRNILDSVPADKRPDVLNAISSFSAVSCDTSGQEDWLNDAVSHLMIGLDRMAGLAGKRIVPLISIAPTKFHRIETNECDEIELAGNFLGNFGGFFSEVFREHDFQAGQAAAGSSLVHGIPSQLPAILNNKNSRSNYKSWPGPDPNEQTPSAVRAAQAVADGLLATLDVPGWLSPWISSWWRPQPSRQQNWAVVRILVAGAPPSSKFYFEGFGGGDDGPASEADTNGRVTIETMVMFDNNRVWGPHVGQDENNRWKLQVCKQSFFFDPRRDVVLPSVSEFERVQNAGFALPRHSIVVEWNEKVPGDWKVQEGLRSLDDRLGEFRVG